MQHPTSVIQEDELESENASVLYRIATNVCLDRLRQYARRNPMESDTDLDQVDPAEPDTPSLQQTLEQDEMSECVQGYLNRLSDSYRAVILLHDMHELTAPEIAWETGTRPVLENVMMLIIRPSMSLGVRICIQVKRMMAI